MTSVLRLDDVSLHRGTTRILTHVTWSVDEGQYWVLLGPNGAGKTTIARIAAARLFPSAGTVEVLGERLGRVDVSELHPRIGLCSSALARTVMGGESVLSVVLSARRPWGSLSSGERKRVEIARALMPDPELLVLDEPAAGLDVAGRELLLAALSEIIAAPGAPSMLLVTHHLEEIPVGFTHALALREGMVTGTGPLGGVLTDEVMSDTFGLPLEVDADRGRYTARGRGPVFKGAHVAR